MAEHTDIIITKGRMVDNETAAYLGYYPGQERVRVCTDKDTRGHYKDLHEAPQYVQEAFALAMAWASDDLHEEDMQDIQTKVLANIAASMPLCVDCAEPFKKSEIVLDDGTDGDNAGLCAACLAKRIEDRKPAEDPEPVPE